MSDEGNLFDPNKGRFNLQHAEQMLGMGDEEIGFLRLVVSVDLLCAHVGITDEQISLAYTARIKSQLSEAANNLRSLVGDDENGE